MSPKRPNLPKVLEWEIGSVLSVAISTSPSGVNVRS